MQVVRFSWQPSVGAQVNKQPRQTASEAFSSPSLLKQLAGLIWESRFNSRGMIFPSFFPTRPKWFCGDQERFIRKAYRALLTKCKNIITNETRYVSLTCWQSGILMNKLLQDKPCSGWCAVNKLRSIFSTDKGSGKKHETFSLWKNGYRKSNAHNLRKQKHATIPRKTEWNISRITAFQRQSHTAPFLGKKATF